jgi:hypothetical protein
LRPVSRRGLLRVLWRKVAFVLPFFLMACGGQGCSGCSVQLPQKQTPASLVLPGSVQGRLTQHGFDVIAKDIVLLMKAVLGTNADGVAVLDPNKLLGLKQISFGGGLGLFQGKASVRDLVLTLDLKALQITLVEGSSPARIRLAIDHARLGVQQGVVSGEANFAGISSDAACHLKNGLDVGKPTAHLATVSANLDLVLGVDAQGLLQVQVAIDQPVLHDVGFELGKDCGLSECTDKVLFEDPCLECTLCDTGKLASDAVVALKGVLQPVLGDILKLVGNLVVQQVIAKSLNGKPLDVELPLDAQALVNQASPQLGALLGTPSGPLYLRGRPSPGAFVVKNQGLDVHLDAAVFAKAHPCVALAGEDTTTAFQQLPQGPPPPIPEQMTLLAKDGGSSQQPVDMAVQLGHGLVEETLWSIERSGLLCLGLDSRDLWNVSGGKLLLSAGAMDLVLPGVRQLASSGAAVRIETMPSARPEDVPLVTLAPGPQGGAKILAKIRGFEVRVAVQTRGRWLTVLELQADLAVQLSVRVVAGTLELAVVSVQPGAIAVTPGSLLPHVDVDALAPAAAQAAVALLLSKPLAFDLDVQQLLAQALALPLQADVVGIEAAGDNADWLTLGVVLQGKVAP